MSLPERVMLNSRVSKEGLKPSENGHHPGSMFEWWYFDSQPTELADPSLVAIFYSPYFNGEPRVTLRLHFQDGREVEKKHGPISKAQADTGRCNLDFGCGRVSMENDGGYRLQVEGDPAVDLKFRPVVPGWKFRANEGVILRNEKRGISGTWIVPCPRAEVEGAIQIGSKKIDYEGVGYHDHNWWLSTPAGGKLKSIVGEKGSRVLSLAREVKGWVWGRVFAGPYTVVYGHVVKRPEGMKDTNMLAIFRDKEIVGETNDFELQGENFRKSKVMGRAYPGKVVLKSDIVGLIELRLENKKVLREDDKLKTERIPLVGFVQKLGLNPQWGYLRAEVEGELKVGGEKISARGINEVTYFPGKDSGEKIFNV